MAELRSSLLNSLIAHQDRFTLTHAPVAPWNGSGMEVYAAQFYHQSPSEHTTEGRSNFNPTSWAEFQIQANGFDLLLEDLDRLMLSTGWYISSAPWSDGWECMELGKRSSIPTSLVTVRGSPVPPASPYSPASTFSGGAIPSIMVQTTAPANPGMGGTFSSFPSGTMPVLGQQAPYGSGMPRSRSVGVPSPQPYATSGAMMSPYAASGMPLPQISYGYPAGYGPGGYGPGGYGAGDYGGYGEYGGYSGNAGVGVPMTAAPIAQYGSYAQPQMPYMEYGGGIGVPSPQAPIIIDTTSRRRHHHHHHHGSGRRSRSHSHGRYRYY
ncbi:hypothetical protein D9757_009689 [Collybiopsis confluens]|uniref:Uncharacterized protein n=1 Tax=Collybiopsis confluens TaxID=2823264 RepID=A0A8H5H244_9AGAR|nr:hypothetical protein D9757_009689 [Collybiopsis confluens]